MLILHLWSEKFLVRLIGDKYVFDFLYVHYLYISSNKWYKWYDSLLVQLHDLPVIVQISQLYLNFAIHIMCVWHCDSVISMIMDCKISCFTIHEVYVPS